MLRPGDSAVRGLAAMRLRLASDWLRHAESGGLKAVSSIGPGGFEPPLTDPKSAVLPLDEGPVD
jgi:hypothetical protein